MIEQAAPGVSVGSGYATSPQHGTPQYGAPQYGAAPQYGQYGTQAYAGYPVAPTQPRALSITSMSLGIAGLVFGAFIPGLISIAAVITGHIGQRREPHAKPFWLTGIITGYIGIAFTLLFWGIMLAVWIGAMSSLSTYSDF